jgi:hypothetical protein
MRTAHFLLVMIIGAVLLQGISAAGQASPVSQEVPSQSSEKSASDQPKDGEVSGEKEQTRSAQADEFPKPHAVVSRKVRHRPYVSYSQSASSHQLRPANPPTTKGQLRTPAPGSKTRLQQTASKVVASKAGNHHSLLAPPPTASVNGQQFKSSRDPGARLASSGGPLTATRGTAAINGTNMKRKP